MQARLGFARPSLLIVVGESEGVDVGSAPWMARKRAVYLPKIAKSSLSTELQTI